MNEYFFAPVYDFLLHPLIHHMRKEVVNKAKQYNAGLVIDMCCGTERQLKYLKQAGIEAAGVDLNDMMLRQAERQESKNLCEKGDARQTTHPENYFDMSMTTLSLHEMPNENAREVIVEMMRITKPGGQLMMIDYDFN